MEVVYVDNKKSLQEVCLLFRQADVIGVDTEFLREKTYYAQLCLIQISGNGLIACIDPLTLDNIDAVLDIIYDPDICKIFHSARQDLEVFYDIRKNLPQNIYDTQVAATFLGHGEQIGYAALVDAVLGVSLAKTETRTDWSRRPLNDRQRAYAADDVRYLHSIYQQQRERLQELQRVGWVYEDLRSLSDVGLIDKPKDKLWQRVKHGQHLQGISLAVLQSLSIWREDCAINRDLPRRWVLSDQSLIDLANRRPSDESEIKNILSENVSKNSFQVTSTATFVEKNVHSILQCIAAAKKIAPERWPKSKGRTDFSAVQLKQIKEIMAIIKEAATQYNVTAPLISSRKDIEALVAGQPNEKLKRGWRYDIVGKHIEALDPVLASIMQLSSMDVMAEPTPDDYPSTSIIELDPSVDTQ
ncbi:MAG: ribonuclease D [Thiohalomonadales bacterium]